MNKLPILLLVLVCAKPFLSFGQYGSANAPKRSLIASIEAGSTLYHIKVAETALLMGLVDNETKDTFELGYIYKHILVPKIGHRPSYHGLRGALQVQVLGSFGFYGTYDIINGQRWLYDDLAGNGLKVHQKIHGEGTLGMFYVPKLLLISFYLGFEPSHYDPEQVKVGRTPHKSTSLSIKLKYRLKI